MSCFAKFGDVNQCCHLLCPYVCAHHYLNKVKLFLNIFSIGPDAFFLAQAKDSNFELKSPTNMTSDRLLID